MKGHIRKGLAVLRDKPPPRYSGNPCQSHSSDVVQRRCTKVCKSPPCSTEQAYPAPFQYLENRAAAHTAKAGRAVRNTAAPHTLPNSLPWTADLDAFTAAQLASCWPVDYPISNGDPHPAWHSARGTCFCPLLVKESSNSATFAQHNIVANLPTYRASRE